MPDRVSTPKAAWVWPIVLVTALHLLSTSGTWWITDHGEILAVADRFLSSGRLDLQDLGAGYAEWTRIVTARGTAETRFLPLSILILTPLLVLDHLAGWHDPASFRFVYLQGHLCIGLGLVAIGRSLARNVSSQLTALGIVVLGLNWPVWMIARRLGPEPVLFLLLSVLATSGARAQIAVLLILPWVHATGPLLGLGAVLWLGTRARSGGSWRNAALAWAGGVLSLALFWNLPVHGSLFLGGYGRYSSDPFFTLRNPLIGGGSLILVMCCWTLPLWYLLVRQGRRSLLPTLALWLPLVGFLGLFSTPEPERRLAPLLAPWLITLLAPRFSLPRSQALVLALLSLLSGIVGLSRDFVDLVATPFGTFTGPMLLLVRLAFVESHPIAAVLITLVLLVGVAIAGSHTLRWLGEGTLAVGTDRPAGPESVA